MTEAEDLGLRLSRPLCKVGLRAKPAERGALAGPEGGTAEGLGSQRGPHHPVLLHRDLPPSPSWAWGLARRAGLGGHPQASTLCRGHLV